MENSESLMANDVWNTPDVADRIMSPQTGCQQCC